MPQIYDPEQLIYQLNLAFEAELGGNPASVPDSDYWPARAALEIARQIERLEATIRAAAVQSFAQQQPAAPPEFADRFRCVQCGGLSKHAPDCPVPRLEARS